MLLRLRCRFIYPEPAPERDLMRLAASSAAELAPPEPRRHFMAAHAEPQPPMSPFPRA